MKLLTVDVERFFGISSAVLNLDEASGVTLLVGANGSGKSSVLKAVQFFIEHYPYQAFVGETQGQPFVGRVGRKGTVSTYISFKKLACRPHGETRRGHIRLVFGLSADEQASFYAWRRLGLVNHIKSALQQTKRAIQITGAQKEGDKGDLKRLNWVIGGAMHRDNGPVWCRRYDTDHEVQADEHDTDHEVQTDEHDTDDAFSVDSDWDIFSDDDTFAAEAAPAPAAATKDQLNPQKLWTALANKLNEVHTKFGENGKKSPFSRMQFGLDTVASDPSRSAQYNQPAFHSADGPANAFDGLVEAEIEAIRTVFDICEQTRGFSLATRKKFYAYVREVHMPSSMKDLKKHLEENWHALETVKLNEDALAAPPGRRPASGPQVTLWDDFHFQLHHKKFWKDRKNFVPHSSAEKMAARDRKEILEDKFETKSHYDGSAPSDSRRKCSYGATCPFLIGKTAWKTRQITHPLMPALESNMPFVELKRDVEDFIVEATDKAFPKHLLPECFRLPPLRYRKMSFVMHALLRTSVAFLQQDRSRRPVCLGVPFELPGVLDVTTASRLLIHMEHAHDDTHPTLKSPKDRVSEALERMLGTSLKIQTPPHGRPFCSVRPLLRGRGDGDDSMRTKHGKPWIRLEHGSGGLIEAFTVLVAAVVSNFDSLVIDEPGHNIHPGAQMALLHELQECAQTSGKALLIVTHSERFVTKESIKACYVAVEDGNGCDIKSLERRVGRLSESESEQLTLAPLSQLLFTQKVVLVEGASDAQVVQMLQRLTSQESNTNLHDVIYMGGGGNFFAVEVAQRLGCDVHVLVDLDKIMSGFSVMSQIITKRGTLKKVAAVDTKIFNIVNRANPNAQAEDNADLVAAIEAFGEHATVFEQAPTTEIRNDFDQAAARLRAEVWRASDRRVYVLSRDLEEEFLKHDSPEMMVVLGKVYRLIEKGTIDVFAPLDEAHSRVANVFAYIRALSHLIDMDFSALVESDKVPMAANSMASKPGNFNNGGSPTVGARTEKTIRKKKAKKKGKGGSRSSTPSPTFQRATAIEDPAFKNKNKVVDLVQTAFKRLNVCAKTCSGCRQAFKLVCDKTQMEDGLNRWKKWVPEETGMHPGMKTTFEQFEQTVKISRGSSQVAAAPAAEAAAAPSTHVAPPAPAALGSQSVAAAAAAPAAAPAAPAAAAPAAASCGVLAASPSPETINTITARGIDFDCAVDATTQKSPCVAMESLKLDDLLEAVQVHFKINMPNNRSGHEFDPNIVLQTALDKICAALEHPPGTTIDKEPFKSKFKQVEAYAANLVAALNAGTLEGNEVFSIVPMKMLSQRSKLFKALHNAGWKQIPFALLKEMCKALQNAESDQGAGEFPCGLCGFARSLMHSGDDGHGDNVGGEYGGAPAPAPP